MRVAGLRAIFLATAFFAGALRATFFAAIFLTADFFTGFFATAFRAVFFAALFFTEAFFVALFFAAVFFTAFLVVAFTMLQFPSHILAVRTITAKGLHSVALFIGGARGGPSQAPQIPLVHAANDRSKCAQRSLRRYHPRVPQPYFALRDGVVKNKHT